MQISFTPNTQLGNHIYDFSATAYEVDVQNLATLIQYNIHDIGANIEMIQDSVTQENIVGQTQIRLNSEQLKALSTNNNVAVIDIMNEVQKDLYNINYYGNLKSFGYKNLFGIQFEHKNKNEFSFFSETSYFSTFG